MKAIVLQYTDEYGRLHTNPGWEMESADGNPGTIIDLRNADGAYPREWQEVLILAKMPAPLIEAAAESAPQGYAWIDADFQHAYPCTVTFATKAKAAQA